ncbi:right-handed parallel beta-helix repeat-containing protein [Haloferula sp.]|uniref:right-handed parallel beta-helix repeat-containing protein n=1 Tax=Haloferula sp. TaxID=2497595 RepID=UPI003C721F55
MKTPPFRPFLLPITFLVLHAAPCFGTDLYVDINNPGSSGSGDDWLSPITKLQDALDEAAIGDTIHIAEGFYYPDEGRARTNNDPAESFILKSGITLLGGYESSGAVRARDPLAHPTILSGDYTQTLDTNSDGFVDNVSGAALSLRVVTINNLAAGVVLDGVGITGGKILGIDCTGTDLELRNCTLRGNNGRAAAVSDTSLNPSLTLTATDCLFLDNGSGQASAGGGGLLVVGMDATIDRCDFLNNRTGLVQGGGLALQTDPNSSIITSAVVRNCRFKGNRATDGGGASVRGLVSVRFENCVISGNRAGNPGVASNGGGVYRSSLVNSGSIPVAGQLTFLNCTIAWNVAATAGGGVFIAGPAPKSVLNTILFKNYVMAEFTSPVSGIYLASGSNAPIYDHVFDVAVQYPGIGNIEGLLSGFPSFEEDVTLTNAPGDALFQPSTTGKLRLIAGTLLTDSASNDWVNASNPELGGGARIQNGTVDYGAYETSPSSGIEITGVSKVGSPGSPLIRIEFTSAGPVDVFSSTVPGTYGSSPIATGQSGFFEKPISQSREFFVLVPTGSTP